MARAANSPVFGPSASVLKQSASNFFSDDVIPGRCSLLAEEKKHIQCTNKHLLILKIIIIDVDLRINASVSKCIISKHNFSLPLLTSNVPFQIGKSTPRCTCIPGCEPLVSYYLRLGFKAGVTKLLPQTQSGFLVQIDAKVYQFDTHSSKNKNLHDLSSYDVIIKNKN